MLAGQAGARSSSWEAGAGGGQLVLRLPAPPSLAQHGHRASAVLPPPGGSSFSAQRESGSAFVRLPEGRKRTPWRGRPGLRRPSFPSSCWGPGRTWPPPSAPAGGASRSAFPHRPFRQGQMVSIPGLGLPGPSGFTSDKWEFSGAVSPASPEDGAFRAPRASVLPGKSFSPSARPSLPPLTFIFQVPPFL